MPVRRRFPFAALHRAALALACVMALSACGGGGSGGGGGGLAAPSSGKPEIVVETSRGIIRVEMDSAGAPGTFQAMIGEVLSGTYDGQTFFDVQPGQFVQFGDADANAAVIQPVQVEPTGAPLDLGAVALMWAGAPSRTTHRLLFPLTRLDSALDDQFTIFGTVIQGKELLPQIQAGDGIVRISTRLFSPIVRLVTQKGSIVIELDSTVAPNHVARISDLTCQGFYNGLTFHRVEASLVQTGDPTGSGDGGTGTTIPAEINERRFFRTAVGMARQPGDLDSADSQFFIMKQQVRELDGQYTFFGQVIAGMGVVDQIEVGDVIQDATLQFDLEGRDCTGTSEPAPGDSGFNNGGTIVKPS